MKIKKKKTAKQKRAQLVEEGLRIVWESLESHLPYTYIRSGAGHKFHKDTIKVYIRLKEILTKLY